MSVQPDFTIPAAEAPKIDAHDLRNYIERFIRDNKDSRDVEHRWLAEYAVDLMNCAFDVKAGNHEKIKPLVTGFRLREISCERAELGNADAELEAEAKKLTAGLAYA